MGFGQGRGERADPLERRFVGKAIVLGVLVGVVVAFVFSAQRADPVHLPGVALDSPFLLDMERAAVVAALVVGAAVFLIRGWVGYFPSKLFTTGAEYATRSTAERTAANGQEAIDVLAEIKLERVAMAESVGEDIRALELKVDALASEVGRAERPTTNIDDMV
jgi:hypothetical protein